MRILVISPVPSHPQRQGNSSRIHLLLRHLQARGHIVHFLYYTREGLGDDQAEAMAACWDAFHPVACTAGEPVTPPPGGWGIDDWYRPELGRAAAGLHRVWGFDSVIVNYVWMSAVLEALPPDLPTAIDTHDVFGHRDDLFRAQGLAPAWFFTTPEEERRGLLRAQTVIAIQPEEAQHFRQLLGGAGPPVLTVGHLLPRRPLPPAAAAGHLRAGFIGSANPLNVRGLQDLLTSLEHRKDLQPHLELVIGGPLARHVPRRLAGLATTDGPVQDLASFYARVDVCVNPMPAGTGLKIKTLEALSYGRALVGTGSAWVGLDAPEGLCVRDATELIDALGRLRDPTTLAASAAACQASFDHYSSSQTSALEALVTALDRTRNMDGHEAATAHD